MLQHVLYVVVMHGVGVLLSRPLVSRRNDLLVYIGAFFWGQAFVVVESALLLLAGVPFTLWSVGALIAVDVVALGAWGLRRGVSWRREFPRWAVSAAAVCLLAYLSASFARARGGGDTYMLDNLAHVLVRNGGLVPGAAWTVLSWGIFVPMTHAFAVLLGIDYFWGLAPVQAALFVGVFSVFTASALGEAALAGVRRRWGLTLSAALLLVTLPIFRCHCLYVHTNLGSAIYLFLALAGAWCAMTSREGHWPILALLAMIGFTMHRHESPLMVLFLLVILGSRRDPLRRQWLMVVATYTVFVLVWYGGLAAVLVRFREPADVRWGALPVAKVLDVRKAACFITLFIVYTVILAAGRRLSAVRRVVHRGGALLTGGLLVGVVVFSLVRPDHLMASLRSVCVNLLCHDPFGWGRTAAACLMIAPLVMRLRRFPHSGLFGRFIVGYLLIVLFLGFLRDRPYRTGPFDSANRMLLALFPAALCYLTLKIGALAAGDEDTAGGT